MMDDIGFFDLSQCLSGIGTYYRLIGQYGKAAHTILDGIEIGMVMPRGAGVSASLMRQLFPDRPFRVIELGPGQPAEPDRRGGADRRTPIEVH